MAFITLLILLLMLITPVISVMAVMLRAADARQRRAPRLQLTGGIMILLSVGIHLLGVRGLVSAYMNLSGSTVWITMLITTVVTLLLGVALGMLVQETRQPNR